MYCYQWHTYIHIHVYQCMMHVHLITLHDRMDVQNGGLFANKLMTPHPHQTSLSINYKLVVLFNLFSNHSQ